MQLRSLAIHLSAAVAVAGTAFLIAALLDLDGTAALTAVIIGASAGWLTNWVAVTWLFRPVNPISVAGLFQLHGRFFQRRDAFGEKLVDMACNRFLHADFFTDLIASDEVAQSLQTHLHSHINDWGSQSPGSCSGLMRQLSSNPQQPIIWNAQAATLIGNTLYDQLINSAHNGSLAQALRPLVAQLAQLRGEQLLGDDHAPLRIAEGLVGWVANNGRHTIARTVRRMTLHLTSTERSLADLFGAQASERLAQVASDYLQNHIFQSLTDFLRRPDLRQRVGSALQQDLRREIEHRIDQMNPIKRWFARTFAGGDMASMVDEIPHKLDGYLDRLESLLDIPEAQVILSDVVAQEVGRLWQRPLSDFANLLPPDAMERLTAAALSGLDHMPTRMALIEQIAHMIRQLGDKTLFSLLGKDSLDALADHLTALIIRMTNDPAQSATMRAGARRMVAVWMERIVETPLPAPAGWSGWPTLRSALITQVVGRIRAVAPGVAGSLPVREHLLAAWHHLPNQTIHDQVHAVLGREFDGLIKAGISIGACGGAIIWALSLLRHYWF